MAMANRMWLHVAYLIFQKKSCVSSIALAIEKHLDATLTHFLRTNVENGGRPM